jgi:hypothetical protein
MAVRKGMKEFKYTREFLDRLFSDDLHAKPVCRATKLATIRTALQVQAPLRSRISRATAIAASSSPGTGRMNARTAEAPWS